MGTEIERKFLVTGDAWRSSGTPLRVVQGYLAYGPPVSVRVRIIGDEANLNVKTSRVSITRGEFEYPIPMADAEQLLAESCQGPPIEKTRFMVEHDGSTWEVDEFHGANEGLVVAEIELDDEAQAFTKPEWVGGEVSHETRYLNSQLSRHPYSAWTDEEKRGTA